MITTYEIIDEDSFYIKIDFKNKQKDTYVKCTKLDFVSKYFKNSNDFVTYIKKDDLENLLYCESIFEFALTNEDKEYFLKTLNNYRKERNFIPFVKKVNNIVNKDYLGNKKSFDYIEEKITKIALQLYDNIGNIATEKGKELQETLLNLINNPNLYIEKPPKNCDMKYSLSKKDLIKILKKYTNEDNIIEDYLSYFL